MISDEELRSAIGALRSADQASTPSLDDVLNRPRPAFTIDARRIVALGLAASVMLVCSVSVARVAMRPRLTITPEVLDLSRWQPSSDALLTSSSLGWYTAPSLSDGVFPTLSNDIPREQYP